MTKTRTKTRSNKPETSAIPSGHSKGRQIGNNALKTTWGLKLNVDVVLMGLDLSTTASGWSVLNGKMELIDYGVIVPDPKAPLFERIRFTRDAVVNKLILYKPTFIAIEELIGFRNGKITKILNYLNGAVALACFEYNGNDVHFIASSSLKKAVSVNPRALKKEGFDRDAIKELCLKRISDIFNLKLRNEEENKYRHDVADATICAFKLYQNLTGNSRL